MISSVQKKYGLWIHNFCRGTKSAGRKPVELECWRQFQFYNISHCFDRRGWFCFDDSKVQIIEKGSVVILGPGVTHKYHGMTGDIYVEDAIAFGGPVADGMFNCGVIKNGIAKLGTARKLLPIIELVIDNTEDSLIKANIGLQNLLIDIYFDNKKPVAGNCESLLEELILEIKNDPRKWWNIEDMAEYCNLSAIQFNRIFKKKTGLTPKNYIDNFKMQMAVDMLADENLSVNDIAGNLGFLDQYHFSRRFKQLKGQSPQNYRKLYRGDYFPGYPTGCESMIF